MSCYNDVMRFEGITLAAVVPELQEALEGGFVQGIYQPLDETLILQVYAGEKRQLLISVGQEARIHLTGQNYENPPAPPAFCMLLRKHLKGGVLETVEQPGLERIIDLVVARRGERRTLRAELMGPHGNVVLLGSDEILGALKPSSGGRGFRPHARYMPPPEQPKLDPYMLDADSLACALLKNSDESLPRALFNALGGIGPHTAKELLLRAGLDPRVPVASLSERERSGLLETIREFFTRLRGGELEPCLYLHDGEPVECTPFPYEQHVDLEVRRYRSLSEALDACVQHRGQEPAVRLARRLGRALKGEIARVEKALGHVAEDLRRSEQYEEDKARADLLMSQLHRIEKGQKRVELKDFEGGTRTIELDPTLGPVENAQKLYERYKKLKRGVDKLSQRKRDLEWELSYLEELRLHLDQAETLEELRDLEGELESEGYITISARKQRAKGPSEPSGPRRYEMDGCTIYVGRNGRQNDALVRGAHREDIWLHAKDRPGAHVIVKGDRKGDVPEPVLQRAAELAAYYSKGRGSTRVPVSYTQVKHLKKPKGTRPGLVLVTQEAGTLLVTPKEEPHS